MRRGTLLVSFICALSTGFAVDARAQFAGDSTQGAGVILFRPTTELGVVVDTESAIRARPGSGTPEVENRGDGGGQSGGIVLGGVPQTGPSAPSTQDAFSDILARP